MKTVILNPYTQAMKNCLMQLGDEEEAAKAPENISQFLANMIQGRFMQYLVNQVCHTHRISDKALEKQLGMVLMNLLSDKFFAVFREKVKSRPEMVYTIAKRITSVEEAHTGNRGRIDALFRGISRHYFEYQNFKIILQWILTNPEVEKIVFLSKIHDQITDPSLLRTLEYIIQNDEVGIMPTVFNRYLVKKKFERLHRLVKSGDWKIEAAFVQEKMAKLINWRHYINRL